MDGIFYLLPLTRLSVFLCCRTQLPQQSILFSIFRLFSYISLSRQVHSTKSVASSSAYLRRIFIRHTLHPLHQSVNLLSKPVFSLLFCQILPFHLFCNNHTSKPIILIATCTQLSVLTSCCTKHDFHSKMRRIFMQSQVFLYVYSTQP